MGRLTAPNGATVSVADDKVARLLDQGYKSVGESKEAPPKKAASPKSNSK